MLYFDHNATTPVRPEVADVYAAALRDVFGNPSSTHGPGQAARRQLEEARRRITAALHVSPAELVFTSGGTESNNLAILGMLRDVPKDAHAVTMTIEHPSVLETFRQAEQAGVTVTYARDSEEVLAALRDNTVLVSVMHANNETGAIEDIEPLAARVKQRRAAGQYIHLHSDGVQAFGKIPVDLNALSPDLYSISAHKICGPKGIGALYVRKNTPLKKILFGGRHERDRRPGTENAPAALAFARAAELATPFAAALRDRFENALCAAVPGAVVNAQTRHRLPNTSNLQFPNISGEALVIALDLLGMPVSTGAACSSGSLEPSHVLLSMGLTRDQARSSVRFSFGWHNNESEITALSHSVIECVARLRRNKETRLAG